MDASSSNAFEAVIPRQRPRPRRAILPPLFSDQLLLTLPNEWSQLAMLGFKDSPFPLQLPADPDWSLIGQHSGGVCGFIFFILRYQRSTVGGDPSSWLSRK